MALGLGFRHHGNQKPSDRSSTWSGPRAPAKEKLVGDQTKVSESKRSCGNIRPEEMEQQSGYIYIDIYIYDNTWTIRVDYYSFDLHLWG